jgi:adenine phosphoribosyltransferase
MQSVLLTSDSPIKIKVAEKLFPLKQFSLSFMNCDECKLPMLPINCVERCAKIKLDYAKRKTFPKMFDYYISIETGIEIDNEDDDSSEYPQEICIVLIEHKGLIGYSGNDVGFSVPFNYYQQLTKFFQDESLKIQGYNTTIGDLMIPNGNSVEKENWIEMHHGTSRHIQIEDQIKLAKFHLIESLLTAKSLLSNCKLYTEFPENSTENITVESKGTFGTMFSDFFSIVREYKNIEKLMDLIADQYRFSSIDYVIGPESRGFLGFGLSCTLGIGFIPVREKGKLPGNLLSLTYEVGNKINTIEIPNDIPTGSRVLIFDDLIATGSSLKAVCDLVELTSCIIVDCILIREMIALREEALKKVGRHYTVLLQD